MEQIRVGLVGWGTVGDSVAGLLTQQEDLIAQRTGVRVTLAKVSDLDLDTPRAHALPRDLLTTRFQDILEDPTIQIVIELVGGTTVAKDILLQAMEKGKHVVTANKALLAEAGRDVFDVARKQGASIGFEASVCGGIPLLASIRRGLIANRIRSVVGIVNGTTNYILTQMSREGQSYEQALKEAQDLGFAEMEPSLDVDGWDACHKLVLLTLLAYGRHVPMESVPTEGITGVSAQDVSYAWELGYVIKLLATAKHGENGLEVGVGPTMVPKDHPLASVDGAYNAVQLMGDWVGRTLFYGLGAGGPATASAIASDVIAIARKVLGKGGDDLLAPSWDGEQPKLCPPEQRTSSYYLRFTVVDRPGVLGLLTTILGEENVSIASVIQKDVGEVVRVVIMTHPASAGALHEALRRIEELDVVKDKTAVLRAVGEADE